MGISISQDEKDIFRKYRHAIKMRIILYKYYNLYNINII